MPAVRRFPGGRTAVVALASVLVLAILGGSALASAPTPLKDGSQTQTRASWESSRGVRSVAATVTVPAISCSEPRAGNAGQLLGVELDGDLGTRRHTTPLPDFAGVLLRCAGKHTRYAEEFASVNPANGHVAYNESNVYRESYVPALLRLTITPGDLVRCEIRVSGGYVRMTITDLSTPDQKPVTAIGYGLRRLRGWAVGMFAVTRQAGPAPSTPALFTKVQVGGGSFVKQSKISTRWTGPSGHTVASVGPIGSRQSEFTAFTSNSPRPWITHNTTAGTASGDIRFQVPGSNQWVRLDSIKQLPDGTTIDSRNGHVELSFGLHGRQTQTAVLWGGEFKFTQNSDGQTTFVVIGQSPIEIAHAAQAGRKTKKKGTGLGSLWSSSHGNYSTQGNYGAAAVRGTTWLTRNEPNGTYFYVSPNRYDANDKIVVTVFAPPAHTVVLGPGQSLLAPAFTPSPTITVGGATEVSGRYNVTVGSFYQLTLVSPVRPYYIDAADAPLGPQGRDSAFFPDGSVNGVPRWTISFQITSNLSNFSTWNVGVLVGSSLYVVPLRIVG